MQKCSKMTKRCIYVVGCPIQNAKSIDILGVTFSIKSDFNQHVDSRTMRTAKCRNISFALSDVGMCYPGIISDAKSYLYRSICQPTLMYGLDAINLSAHMLKKLQNTQGSIIKRVWHSETLTPHAVTACP